MNIPVFFRVIFIGTLLLCPRLLIDLHPGNGTDSEVGSTKTIIVKGVKKP